VQLAVSAVRDSGGAPIGYIGVAQDISLRQAADREIRDLNQTLQQTVGELESFSYSVSHDLRAPLRHIDGYSRMLIDDLGDRLDEEPRRFLDSISRSSRRMGQLIDDLLSLSRLGRKALARQAVDMTLLAEETWKEVAVDMRSEAEFVLAPLPTISGDPALLRQVWLNLLSNAAKYSARKGAEARIEVSAVRDEDTVTYHVKDNGVGFDSRYADKLFGVFQRLHAQDEFEGTGVGLAIVHRIVVRHGGTVSAEAEPGIGAHFSFALPDREIE
jgi:light-regulated signal transduction histidine kinase (bacteriophytochrome)